MPYVPTTDEVSGELSPEERDRLIDDLARRVVDRRLEMPAVLFLEMHKPVTFLASQSLLMAGPLLAPLFGIEGMRRYSQLLATRENVELLIRRIENLAEERDAAKRRVGETETGKRGDAVNEER